MPIKTFNNSDGNLVVYNSDLGLSLENHPMYDAGFLFGIAIVNDDVWSLCGDASEPTMARKLLCNSRWAYALCVVLATCHAAMGLMLPPRITDLKPYLNCKSEDVHPGSRWIALARGISNNSESIFRAMGELSSQSGTLGGRIFPNELVQAVLGFAQLSDVSSGSFDSTRGKLGLPGLAELQQSVSGSYSLSSSDWLSPEQIAMHLLAIQSQWCSVSVRNEAHPINYFLIPFVGPNTQEAMDKSCRTLWNGENGPDWMQPPLFRVLGAELQGDERVLQSVAWGVYLDSLAISSKWPPDYIFSLRFPKEQSQKLLKVLAQWWDSLHHS